MNNELIFSSFELDMAQSLLAKIVPQASVVYDASINEIVNEKISNENINQMFINSNKFYGCHFKDSDFSSYALQSSTFINNYLMDISLKGTNLNYSDFSGSTLTLNAFSTNLCNCDFSKSILKGNYKNCMFKESYFENTTIKNCVFEESDFSDSIFINCKFIDINLAKVSMRNTAFINCQFINTVFPYFEVLAISRGILDIVSDNNITFKPVTSDYTASKQKYLEEIYNLLPVFWKEKNYVAIANVYIALGSNNKAYQSIIEGLKYSCENRRFEFLRQLCTIASSNNIFTSEQLKDFYNLLEYHIDTAKLSKVEYMRYLDELNYAYQKLIDTPFNSDYISIHLKTNFNYTEINKIADTISIIYKIIDIVDSSMKNNLVIRHNSPPDIVINISGELTNLLLVFNCLAMIFKGSTAFAEKILGLKEKYNSVKLQDMEKRLKALQIQELENKKGESKIVKADYAELTATIDSMNKFPKELRNNRISG